VVLAVLTTDEGWVWWYWSWRSSKTSSSAWSSRPGSTRDWCGEHLPRFDDRRPRRVSSSVQRLVMSWCSLRRRRRQVDTTVRRRTPPVRRCRPLDVSSWHHYIDSVSYASGAVARLLQLSCRVPPSPAFLNSPLLAHTWRCVLICGSVVSSLTRRRPM